MGFIFKEDSSSYLASSTSRKMEWAPRFLSQLCRWSSVNALKAGKTNFVPDQYEILRNKMPI